MGTGGGERRLSTDTGRKGDTDQQGQHRYGRNPNDEADSTAGSHGERIAQRDRPRDALATLPREIHRLGVKASRSRGRSRLAEPSLQDAIEVTGSSHLTASVAGSGRRMSASSAARIA